MEQQQPCTCTHALCALWANQAGHSWICNYRHVLKPRAFHVHASASHMETLLCGLCILRSLTRLAVTQRSCASPHRPPHKRLGRGHIPQPHRQQQRLVQVALQGGPQAWKGQREAQHEVRVHTRQPLQQRLHLCCHLQRVGGGGRRCGLGRGSCSSRRRDGSRGWGGSCVEGSRCRGKAG